MQRYPEGIEISPEAFRNCGWLEAVEGVNREDYSSLWTALSSLAKRTIEEGKLSEGKVLWLLADACSMMLKPFITHDH